MDFNFLNLDAETREIMLAEIKEDIVQGRLYSSKRFSPNGEKVYPELLTKAATEGNETTLANDLRKAGGFKDQEERKTKSGISLVAVPKTAPDTFAEGEFNRYYIRALCVKAIEMNQQVEIYRARESGNPRSASLAMVGNKVDPSRLLEDLKSNVGVDTALGLPPGPNSGLSAKL